jgi:ribosomal protein S27AE
MTNKRAALGGMLEQLVDLGVIEFRPEPLDAIVERRLKTIWSTRTCPNCDADALHALDGSARIWCGRCDWKTTYTRGTPFYDSELAPASSSSLSSSTLIPSLASTRSRRCSTAPTKPSSRQLTTWKPRSLAVSRPSGTVSITRLLDQHRSMKHSRSARASKVRIHRGTDCPAAGLLGLDGHDGQESRAMR